jgi:hypothetical protein
LSLTRQLFETTRRADAPLQLGALGALGGQDYIKKLRVKYAGFNQKGIIDQFLKYDFAGPRQKYLAWMLYHLDRQALKRWPDEGLTMTDLIVLVKAFHANRTKLPVKDLYRYSPETLQTALERARFGRGLRGQNNSPLVIQETPGYVVLYLKTHEDACFFGRGTKWCITETDITNFNSYAQQNLGTYLLFNRRLSSKNSLYKVALQEPQGPHSKPLLLAALDASMHGSTERSKHITDARDDTLNASALARSLDRSGGNDGDYVDGNVQLQDIFARIYAHAIKQSPRPEYLALSAYNKLHSSLDLESVIQTLEQLTDEEREHLSLQSALSAASDSPALSEAIRTGKVYSYEFWLPVIRHRDAAVRAFAAYTCNNSRALMELVSAKNQHQEVLRLLLRLPLRANVLTWGIVANLLLRPYTELENHGEVDAWRTKLLGEIRAERFTPYSWTSNDYDRNTLVAGVRGVLELATNKHTRELPPENVDVFLKELLKRADLGTLTTDVHEAVWRRIIDEVEDRLHTGGMGVGYAPEVWRLLFEGPSAYKVSSEALAQKYLDFSERRIAKESPEIRRQFHEGYGLPFVRSRKMSDAGLEILRQVPELAEPIRSYISASFSGLFTRR